MHEYYAANRDKFKKGMDKFLSLVAPELEKISGKKYAELFEEIWDYYERHLLERFPFVGGDKVSGTRNLTGAYYFVAMGEVFYRETAHTTTLIAVTAANSTTIQRIVATFLSGRNHFGEGSGCEG